LNYCANIGNFGERIECGSREAGKRGREEEGKRGCIEHRSGTLEPWDTGTRNPKPETRNPEPETRNPKQ
jgi:hypothetical protein